MDKKTKILFVIVAVMFIIVMVILNILIKRYEKEPLIPAPLDIKKSVFREKLPIQKPAEPGLREIEPPEEEPPLSKTEPLLN